MKSVYIWVNAPFDLSLHENNSFAFLTHSYHFLLHLLLEINWQMPVFFLLFLGVLEVSKQGTRA